MLISNITLLCSLKQNNQINHRLQIHTTHKENHNISIEWLYLIYVYLVLVYNVNYR